MILTVSPATRRRLVATLRWVAAVALLVAMVSLLREPLAHVLPGFDGTLNTSGIDSVFGPAPGFLVRASSKPAGGTLWIDGELQGSLPLIGNVVCRDGDEVQLEIRLDGHSTWRRTVQCREGGELEVSARLQPVG